MIYRALILVSLLCLLYSLTDATINRPTRSVNCDDLNKPDWTADSLSKESLDLWPWNCLSTRPVKASLTETIRARAKTIENNSISKNSVLHQAAALGLLEAVRFFVDVLNYAVDVRNAYNDTPLHAAAGNGHLPVLKYLIDEKGADAETKNEDDDTLLHFAAENGRLDVVKYLVEQKSLNASANNSVDKTPMLLAVINGHLDVVKYFVDEKKATLDGKKSRAWGPGSVLHCAVYSENLDLVKYLVDDAKMLTFIDEVNWSGRTAAMEAANWNQLDILKFLVDDRNASTTISDKTGHNMLHTAAQRGRLSIVKYLVGEKGFDVNSKTRGGDTTYESTKHNGFLYANKKQIDAVLEYLLTKMK